jgi:hypothetical protein
MKLISKIKIYKRILLKEKEKFLFSFYHFLVEISDLFLIYYYSFFKINKIFVM